MLYETIEAMAIESAKSEERNAPAKRRKSKPAKGAAKVAKLDRDATAFLAAHGFDENGEDLSNHN